MEERSVRLAAGEGIVAIAERANTSVFHPVDFSENMLKVGYEDVINQMKALSIEAGGRGTSKKELGNQRSFFNDALAYIQVGLFLCFSSRMSQFLYKRFVYLIGLPICL